LAIFIDGTPRKDGRAAQGNCQNPRRLATTNPPIHHPQIVAMVLAPDNLKDLVTALPSADGWGPSPSTETMINGVPYAPYSKGDKLGRMADWTEGKDRDNRGRNQYGGRNYRGMYIRPLGLAARFATFV
jgi:hypothetical protein